MTVFLVREVLSVDECVFSEGSTECNTIARLLQSVLCVCQSSLLVWRKSLTLHFF